MGCYLAIKDKQGEYKHYKVPREVYIYVIQLENKIKEKE